MNRDAFALLQSLVENRPWGLEFVTEAVDDLKSYANSGLQEIILKAILEGHKNPLPKSEGGSGNVLGKDHKTGDGRPALYWKLRNIGVRIVYGLEPPIFEENQLIKKQNVLILVIGPRKEKEVYHSAVSRLKKYRPRLAHHKTFSG